MGKKKNNLPLIPIVLICALLSVAVVLVFLLGNRPEPTETEDAVSVGIAYLESLEEKDPAVVQQVRKEIRQRKIDAQRDELLEQLTDGTIDPFSLDRKSVV